MRKIAATYIFPLCGPPVKNGILVCDDDGIVVEIINRGESFREEAGVEFYSGILVPGFIGISSGLQNRNKTTNRKYWANGFAVLANIEKNTSVVCERNEFKEQPLIRPVESRKDSSSVNSVYFKSLSEAAETGSLLNYCIQLQEVEYLEITEILKKISLNVSELLGLDNKYGSFESGKQPGVNLISGIDFKQMKLTVNTKVKRLL
ncbi:hypothetical protein [uncultured Draconibacterium sp.]|uniref:hypothetical protein n=1 Tax=uncultured Draconibacterium sp. TaxID=1573823 RepID=UPI0032166C4E